MPRGECSMAHVPLTDAAHAPAARRASLLAARPTYQAYRVLHIGFAVLPILAGLDKFFDLLANWDKYLAPLVTNVVPGHAFMLVVGVIEIVAGLIVAARPRIGAYVVMLW